MFYRAFYGQELILMPHILPTSTNETISKEIGDYYPVFYNTFARSVQSAETLQNVKLHTDRSTVLFFINGAWKQ